MKPISFASIFKARVLAGTHGRPLNSWRKVL
jgi:hypothetical protein